MSGRATIVVPLKGLAGGKTRLGDVLADDERIALVRRLIERTLEVVLSLQDVAVFVVSPDPEALALVPPRIEAVRQNGRGLNEALAQVAATLAPRRTVIVPGDLPGLSADDVERHLGVGGVGLSPDQRERGTNMLSLPAPEAIPFRFGEDSLNAHRAAATEAGLSVDFIYSPGLCFDLDTPEDLARLKVWP